MSEPDRERHLVLFSLHGEHYALPVGTVREIIRYVTPSATAAARGLIQGMINLRGRVVPVVDLSTRLGKRLEVGSGTRILVLELANGTLGLIVDAVDKILRVPAEQVEPLPPALADNAFGAEIAAIDERLVLLVDPERALGEVLPPPPPPPPRPKPAAPRRRSKPPPADATTAKAPARPARRKATPS